MLLSARPKKQLLGVVLAALDELALTVPTRCSVLLPQSFVMCAATCFVLFVLLGLDAMDLFAVPCNFLAHLVL